VNDAVVAKVSDSCFEEPVLDVDVGEFEGFPEVGWLVECGSGSEDGEHTRVIDQSSMVEIMAVFQFLGCEFVEDDVAASVAVADGLEVVAAGVDDSVGLWQVEHDGQRLAYGVRCACERAVVERQVEEGTVAPGVVAQVNTPKGVEGGVQLDDLVVGKSGEGGAVGWAGPVDAIAWLAVFPGLEEAAKVGEEVGDGGGDRWDSGEVGGHGLDWASRLSARRRGRRVGKSCGNKTTGDRFEGTRGCGVLSV